MRSTQYVHCKHAKTSRAGRECFSAPSWRRQARLPRASPRRALHRRGVVLRPTAAPDPGARPACGSSCGVGARAAVLSSINVCERDGPIAGGIVQLICSKRAVPRWRTGINRAANGHPFYTTAFSKARTAEDLTQNFKIQCRVGLLERLGQASELEFSFQTWQCASIS